MRLPYVLMYHSITPYREDPYLITVHPRRFEQQMCWLRRNGLRGASVREVLDTGRTGPAPNLVGLTFDDGYADFVDHALPVLSRYGFTATVFVIAGRFGGSNEWDALGPRKPLMSSRQVRYIADAGMEIGSHGLCHVKLPATSDRELVGELRSSRRALEDASGQEVAGFCYPYGQLDGRVVDGVQDSGYRYGCAIWRSEYTGRYALPRSYIGDADTPLRLRVKRLRHQMRWLNAG